jgi:choline dehydrogenase-like flavoprotein
MVPYVRRLFGTEPVASLLMEETLPGADCRTAEAILEAGRTWGTWGFHTCGTARMGADREAVVDAELRVCGVQRLRVVDASVFPTIVSANTTAAVAAVAWRAADMILADTQQH